MGCWGLWWVSGITIANLGFFGWFFGWVFDGLGAHDKGGYHAWGVFIVKYFMHYARCNV